MPDNTRPDAHKKKGELVDDAKSEMSKPKDITPLVTSILSRITVQDESPMHQVGFTLPGKGNEPAKFVTLTELVKEYKTYEDLALVHDIAIDDNFRLTKVKNNDKLYQMIAQTMHNAFWDSMRDELKQVPPKKERAINLLMDIKTAFRALLEGNNDRALSHIELYLEETKVRQQIDNDDKAVVTYTDFIINMMGMACSKARDGEVENLMRKTDIVDRLRGIMELLENMQLDMANFVLRLARVELAKHSIQYEQQKFAELRILANDNYPATAAWLMRSYKQLPVDDAAVAGPSAENSLSDTKLQNVLKSAYMELLDPNIDHAFPELLILDKERMMQLRGQVLRLTICCVVTSLACRWGLPSDEQNRADVAEKLMILAKDCTSRAMLKDVLDSLWVQVKTMIAGFLEDQGVSPPEVQNEALLKAEILKLEDEDSLPFSVVKNKLLHYLEQPSLAEKGAETVPLIFKAHRDEVINMSKTLNKIVKHNRAVYGEYYEEQIKKF